MKRSEQNKRLWKTESRKDNRNKYFILNLLTIWLCCVVVNVKQYKRLIRLQLPLKVTRLYQTLMFLFFFIKGCNDSFNFGEIALLNFLHNLLFLCHLKRIRFPIWLDKSVPLIMGNIVMHRNLINIQKYFGIAVDLKPEYVLSPKHNIQTNSVLSLIRSQLDRSNYNLMMHLVLNFTKLMH